MKEIMRNGILKILFISILIITTAYGAANNSAWLSEIENNFFGIDYPNDTEGKRLQRIEKVLYGSEQKGTPEARLKKISQDTGTTYDPKKAQNKPAKNDQINAPLPSNQQQPKPENYVAEDSTVDYPIVDKMEEKLFNKKYTGENIYKRLDRLEQKVFNSTSKDVLNTRVERLSDALLSDEKQVKRGDPGYNPYPSSQDSIGKYSTNPSGTYSDDNLSVQLSAIERNNFNKVYGTDTVAQRLNRLEKHLLGKTFSQDNPQVRLERIMAVNVAQNNSAMYDNNKVMRNVATFSQIGGIILMLLAIIL